MAVRGVIESGTTLDFTRYTVRLDGPDLQANHAFARVFHPFPPEDEVPDCCTSCSALPSEVLQARFEAGFARLRFLNRVRIRFMPGASSPL